MAEISYVKKQFNNTLFNEKFLISNESDKRKLVNAFSFLNLLEKTHSDQFNQPLLYDGIEVKIWLSNVERRINEIDTIKCYENVSIINVARGGSVEITYCDGSKGVKILEFGETIIKDCIIPKYIKPYTDGKKYRIPAILKGIRYVRECGSTTTTTTTSQGDSYECTPKFGCIRSEMGGYKTLEDCQNACAKLAV